MSTGYFDVRTFLDASEQERALGRWEQRYTQLGKGNYEGSITRLAINNIELVEERTNVVIDQITCPPKGTLLLALPIRQSGNSYVLGEAHEQECGFLHLGGHDINVVSATETRGLLLTVEARDFDGLDLARLPALSSLAGYDGMEELCSWLQSVLESAPEVVRSPGGEMQKIIPNMIKDRVWEICSQLLQNPQRTAVRSNYAQEIVNKSRDYITKFDEEPFGVREMASALDVPEYILRTAFLQATGLSPRAWLRQQRLGHVRRQLLSADTRTAMSDIAMEHGFFHFGRFAAYYAETFGEKPTDTRSRNSSFQRPAIA